MEPSEYGSRLFPLAYTQCTLILEVQFLLVNQVYASACMSALPLVTYLLCKSHPRHHEAPLCAALFII